MKALPNGYHYSVLMFINIPVSLIRLIQIRMESHKVISIDFVPMEFTLILT